MKRMIITSTWIRLAACSLLLGIFATESSATLARPDDDIFDFLGEFATFPDPDEARDRESWAEKHERNAAQIEDLLGRAKMFHQDATIAYEQVTAALEPIGQQQDPGDVAFVVGECRAAETRASKAGEATIAKREAAESAAEEACRLAGSATNRQDLEAARSAHGRASGHADAAARDASTARDAAEETGALARRLADVPSTDRASIEAALKRAETAQAKIEGSLAGLSKIASEAVARRDFIDGDGAGLVAKEALARAEKATAEILRLRDEVRGFSRSAKRLAEVAGSVESSDVAMPGKKEIEGLAASAEFAAGHAAKESDRARRAARDAQGCIDRAWAGLEAETRTADADGGTDDEDFDDLFDDIEDEAFAGVERQGARQEEQARRDRSRVRTAAAGAARDADEYTRGVRERQRDSYDDFTQRMGDEIAIANAEQRRQSGRTSGSTTVGRTGLGGTTTTTPPDRTRVGSTGTTSGGTPNRFFLTCDKYVSCEFDRLVRQGMEEEDWARARATLRSSCPPVFNQIGYPSKSECVSMCKSNSHRDTHPTCVCICS